jgi:putative cell wall-binding protein
VYVVSGENFPDALAAGPVAALRSAPILLTQKGSIPGATVTELSRLQPKSIVVVGGSGVISDVVFAELDDYTTGSVTRVWGTNRYETAAAISKSWFNPGVSRVFLVTGEKFPDGLAAGPAAALFGGPVLLTSQASLPAPTVNEIVRLNPGRVTIVGGTGAVSANVAGAVGALGIPVDRVAGNSRYSTAAAVSAEFFAVGNEPTFLATGQDYPDALTGAAAAGAAGGSVLLTDPYTLSPPTATELTRLYP